MISLADEKWNQLSGGSKTKYNPVEIIKLLQEDIFSVEAWDLIWENLHHHGDIGEASYAIIPYLINLHIKNKATDWQLYSYVALIIQESHRKTNPKIPDWIADDLKSSLEKLFEMSKKDLSYFNDEIYIRSILGFIALYKGLFKYGALISTFTESEIDEIIENRMAWTELYE